jgi:hypothetical protein
LKAGSEVKENKTKTRVMKDLPKLRQNLNIDGQAFEDVSMITGENETSEEIKMTIATGSPCY